MRPSSDNWNRPYIAGPGPHEGLEPAPYLLESQHSNSGQKESRSFPTDDNEERHFLDLTDTNKEELVEEVKVGGQTCL